MTHLPSVPGLRTFSIPGTQGHDVVYGLAAGPPGMIYLSVSNEFTPGVCAYVCSFDSRTSTFRKVIDIAEATGYDRASGHMPHSKIHLSLNSTPDGRAFAATHFTAPAVGQTSFDPIEAYRFRYEGSHVVEYDPRRDCVIDHGCLLPGEGCRVSAIDAVHEYLYLLSYPRNHLFQYHYSTGKLRDLGRLGQENPFGIEVDRQGDVYTTDDLGRLLRYSCIEDRIEELDLFLPLKPGRRRHGNYARRTIFGLDGCIYGFANKGARLFRFRPDTRELCDLGVIYGSEGETNYRFPALPPAKALVQTDPNTLYVAFGGDGIYIDEMQIPSLVRYDLANAAATDVGRFIDQSGIPAWIPQCALFKPENRCIYFGMQQAIGELQLWQVCLDDSARHAYPEQSLESHLKKVTQVPFGASVEGSTPMPYVSAGRIAMTELGWCGEGLVIPPGESAIAGLVFDKGTLYGITKGFRSHFFRYDPYRQNRFLENYDVHLCDLGIVCERPVHEARILPDAAHGRLIAVLETDGEIRVIEYLKELEQADYRPHYHSVPHWPLYFSRLSPFRLLCRLARTEISLNDLVLESTGSRLLSLCDSGELVCLDLESGMIQTVQGPQLRRRSLLATKTGQLLGITDASEGVLINHRGDTTTLFNAESTSGHEFTCAIAGSTGAVAVGTCDGTVYIWDLAGTRAVKQVALGWPARVRTMTFGKDGNLYGFCGKDHEIGEAFSIQMPETHFAGIGILQVPHNPRYWICHRCDCSCAGDEGEIYFGESDRVSHLFTYRSSSLAGIG